MHESSSVPLPSLTDFSRRSKWANCAMCNWLIWLILFLLFLVAAVVRQVVMPVADADLGVAAVAAVVGHHERGDPRLVGLERQCQQVHHQSGVLAVDLGDAAGLAACSASPPLPSSSTCAIRDSTSRTRVQVLIELLLVADAEPAAQVAGVFLHEIEDALSSAVRASTGSRRPRSTWRCRTAARRPAADRPPWEPASFSLRHEMLFE